MEGKKKKVTFDDIAKYTKFFKNNCDVLIHVNSDVPSSVPSYGRIKGFSDICEQHISNTNSFLQVLETAIKKHNNALAIFFQLSKKNIPI